MIRMLLYGLVGFGFLMMATWIAMKLQGATRRYARTALLAELAARLGGVHGYAGVADAETLTLTRGERRVELTLHPARCKHQVRFRTLLRAERASPSPLTELHLATLGLSPPPVFTSGRPARLEPQPEWLPPHVIAFATPAPAVRDHLDDARTRAAAERLLALAGLARWELVWAATEVSLAVEGYVTEAAALTALIDLVDGMTAPTALALDD
jgi:hypothetical protein